MILYFSFLFYLLSFSTISELLYALCLYMHSHLTTTTWNEVQSRFTDEKTESPRKLSLSLTHLMLL